MSVFLTLSMQELKVYTDVLISRRKRANTYLIDNKHLLCLD